MNDSMISSVSDEKPVPVSSVTTPIAAPAAPTPALTSTTPQSPSPSPSPLTKRDSLNGSWILDKSRGEWSMRGYLETLNVPELAIQANEKGENELDTVHEIELNDEKVKIAKRSRVNNNLVVELTLGKYFLEYLKPDERPKKQLATTEDPGKHLKIVSSLLTVNGMAHVTDIKRLIQETKGPVLLQELIITNPESNKTHTTTRYFNPHHESVIVAVATAVAVGKIGELGAVIAAVGVVANGNVNNDVAVKMETD